MVESAFKTSLNKETTVKMETKASVTLFLVHA